MSNNIETRGYVHPEVLVSTDWIADHINDPKIRIVESNEDALLYRSGHITNAVEIDWIRDLNNPIRRDYLDAGGFSELCSRFGITPETTVVFYGDKNNWWACYAFWVFQLFGHTNAKILDGGRVKWEKEKRELSMNTPAFTPSAYPVIQRNDSEVRAFRDDVLKHLEKSGQLIDVRSPDEYTGKKLHMEGYPNEGALRGGHIPGAKSVPWSRAINVEDGTFKASVQLKEIYEQEAALNPDKDCIVYCRIGERSSHTWFVLTYLLGHTNVKNYDGSWTEWGNLVNVPVEK